jgi:flagellar L-ring protein precursor FlgH
MFQTEGAMRAILISLLLLLSLLGCGRTSAIGKPPEFSQSSVIRDRAMGVAPSRASLWSASNLSLLGDRRAMQRGDILTVVVEIDDKAEISNTSSRSRTGSEQLQIPEFLGIPQRLSKRLGTGVELDNAVTLDSNSQSNGNGSVKRNEKLTLRIAATVQEILPNGVMAIQGSQEVRVNFELRELLVSGYVRPEDISRQNEITYDKIASARVSYGGRGQISDVQQPRYGQQITDALLPF